MKEKNSLWHKINSLLDEASEITNDNLPADTATAAALTVAVKNDDEMSEYLSELTADNLKTNLTANGYKIELSEPYSFKNFLVFSVILVNKESDSAIKNSVAISSKSLESVKAKAFEKGYKITDGINKVIVESESLTIEIANNSKKDEKSESSDELLKALEEEKLKRIELLSDFQNYQKRVELEKSTWGAISNIGIVKEILEIHDDIGLALSDENLSTENAKSSLKSAQEKLIAAVERVGIEKIPVALGDDFDKETMEAVSTLDSGSEQKNKVIAVISSAYKYKNKDGILSAAKVIVGK